MRFGYCLMILLVIFQHLFAQDKKNVEALYISEPLNLDGVLDESVYGLNAPAKDFVQLQPYNGKPSMQASEVYFFYDQTAIYLGAMLYDSAPDSIFNNFSERDNIGMSDYFGVYLDPYNQGQLAYGFFVTSSGVQTDLKAVKTEYDYEDNNWNAVWKSETKINDKGWCVEMRIPYSALRFSEKDVHIWGINMFRNIRRYNSNNSWNFVDRNMSGFIHQQGTLTGIKDIKPPVRLSISPYMATYLENNGGGSSNEFVYKGGLDLKFGVSESFTLDMMLVPDFGQIQSDDKELNLSPYELYYDEKRQFFNEGTELFQRGEIFYSRRIGASPVFSDKANENLAENEIVDFLPNETQLINATKFSGRTTKGWGIGTLFAMSLPSYGVIKDTISGITRKEMVQPFTNYNVSVLDKSLKNNSYISLINSNMKMIDNPFTANVTATEFQIRNKAKTYAVSGKAGVSLRGDSSKESGFFNRLAIDKNKGSFQFGILQEIFSDNYNPNDIGYLRNSNQLLTESYLYYQIITPFWIIRECSANIWWDYFRVYNPSTVFKHGFGSSLHVLFKNNYRININGGIETDKHDYYEPRIVGWHFDDKKSNFYNIRVNTDSRKSLSFSTHYGLESHPTTDQFSHTFDNSVSLRIGQKTQLFYYLFFSNNINNLGYVSNSEDEDSIFFAKRNIVTIENVFQAAYAINKNMSFNIRARHYWSGAKNKEYFLLQPDGSLIQDPNYDENNDQNYNTITVDIIFRWIFAPGSELSLAWKNDIMQDNSVLKYRYMSNLADTWHSDQINSISLKVLYYIDYNSLFRKKK